MARSILAVVVGYSLMAISVRVLFTLRPGGPTAEEGVTFLLFGLLYGTIFAGAAGYVTALIAKHAEMVHAGILVVLLVPTGIISIALGGEPLWYRIADFLTAIVAVMVGGRLRADQVRKAKA